MRTLELISFLYWCDLCRFHNTSTVLYEPMLTVMALFDLWAKTFAWCSPDVWIEIYSNTTQCTLYLVIFSCTVAVMYWPGLIVVDVLPHCESKHAVGVAVTQRHGAHVHVEAARSSEHRHQGPRDVEVITSCHVRHRHPEILLNHEDVPLRTSATNSAATFSFSQRRAPATQCNIITIYCFVIHQQLINSFSKPSVVH